MYNIDELIQQVRSTILMLLAHPDNLPGSEFDDRISGLNRVLQFLTTTKNKQ